MATEKRGHASRPAEYLLAGTGNMGQSPSSVMLTCRLATAMPCLTSIEQCLPNHQRKPSCHNSDTYRSNSGVLGFKRRSGVPRITSSSANRCTVLNAPQGPVTYLQLCKPMIPSVRANSSRLRSHDPYIHKSRVDDTLKHININAGLVVCGAALGQIQPYTENVKQEVGKVQFHVYLPCHQHGSEDFISTVNSLNLQECKIPEDDNMATV